MKLVSPGDSLLASPIYLLCNLCIIIQPEWFFFLKEIAMKETGCILVQHSQHTPERWRAWSCGRVPCCSGRVPTRRWWGTCPPPRCSRTACRPPCRAWQPPPQHNRASGSRSEQLKETSVFYACNSQLRKICVVVFFVCILLKCVFIYSNPEVGCTNWV